MSPGDDQWSTVTIDSEETGDIYGNDHPSVDPPEENNHVPEIISFPNGGTQQNENVAQGVAHLDQLPIPKNKSIAHNYIVSGNIVYCSFDIQTGGEFCGIVQMSAQKLRISGGNTIEVEEETFNAYVKPGDGAIWDERLTSIHGLSAAKPEIQSTPDIFEVWTHFCHFVTSNIGSSETIILLAYNGKSCDLKWIWKLTQAPNSRLNMPPQIKLFLDPYQVINHFKSCKLNPAKSKLESLSLGCVWTFLKDQNLNGAHDSLVDVKAQTDVVTDDFVIPFINRTTSIRAIHEIFSRREQSEMMEKMEPFRSVHLPWVEINKDEQTIWTPSMDDSYFGFQSGGRCGPSSKMIQTARTKTDLCVCCSF